MRDCCGDAMEKLRRLSGAPQRDEIMRWVGVIRPSKRKEKKIEGGGELGCLGDSDVEIGRRKKQGRKKNRGSVTAVSLRWKFNGLSCGAGGAEPGSLCGDSAPGPVPVCRLASLSGAAACPPRADEPMARRLGWQVTNLVLNWLLLLLLFLDPSAAATPIKPPACVIHTALGAKTAYVRSGTCAPLGAGAASPRLICAGNRK